MYKDLKYTGNLTWLQQNTILLAKHGSHAYGLNTPTSDIDFKGIAIPPKSYFLGTDRFEQAEFKDLELNAEAVVYELRKFCKLAAECNPNIIEVLWSDPEVYTILAPAGQKLVENRELFLSKKARYTFSGYAHAQLKRIKHHYGWIRYGENIKEPTRKDFGLPERTLISADQRMAAMAAVQKKLDRWNLKALEDLEPATRIAIMNGVTEVLTEMKIGSDETLWMSAARYLGMDSNFIEILDYERRYISARKEWDSYQEWKKNRNPDRAALEEKYGYDSKHAMHLVRLVRMCGEILDTGKVIVKRPDRDELLAIRNGAWSYEQLIEYAETEDKRMDEKYNASTLKHNVDLQKVNELCTSLVEKALF